MPAKKKTVKKTFHKSPTQEPDETVKIPSVEESTVTELPPLETASAHPPVARVEIEPVETPATQNQPSSPAPEPMPTTPLTPEVSPLPPPAPEPTTAAPVETVTQPTEEKETESLPNLVPQIPNGSGIESAGSSKIPPKLVFAAVIVLVVLVGLGFFLFSGKKKTPTPTPPPAATEAPLPTATAIASPAANLKREDLKIQVLNGSGVAGAAGKAKSFLESLGYKNVNTGNAETSDLATTTVAIKDSKQDYSALLKKDLSGKYTLADEIQTLAASNSADVVVTIGLK
jgi:hypothetical protein